MNKEEDAKHPLDQELENGPIEKRYCRDLFCCLLFLAAFIAMLAIGIYGYKNGEPGLLALPYDSDGNGCGFNSTVKDYPYIYFVVPWPGYLSRTVCLKSCPNYQHWSLNLTLDCVPNSKVSQCSQTNVDDILTSSFPPSGTNLSASNMVFVYNTTGIFGRICFPTTSYLGKVNLGNSTLLMQSEQWMNDLKYCWVIIFVSLGIALVFGFVYMVLMRYCSGIFTWLAILAYILALIAFGYILFDKAKANEASLSNAVDDQSQSSNQSSSNNTLRIAAYVLWALAGLTVLLICCLYTKIKLAIAIIKTASSFMKDCPLVLFVPIIIFVFVVGWLAYWISAALFLYSVGTVDKYGSTPFASVTWNTTTRYLIIYFIFGGLWVNAFILAVDQFVLGSTVAIWYFSQQKPHAPISRSFYRAFRYHLGSLAFGSFILAVVQFIRLVLTYIETQLKKTKQDTKIVKCILCYCKCFMLCLEKCIKFLNKNAYIQISISGKNFCFAAKDAFFLILRNPAKFGVVASIGELFIFIGKIFIAALGTIASFAIISYCEPYKSEITSPVLPTIFFFIAALAVGILFMSVYGMAIDSILQCYCLDEELNKSKGKDPAHSPAPLREFMDRVEKENPKKNQVEDKWDK